MKHKNKKSIECLFNIISKGVKDVYKTENWKNHLKTISKFYNYSERNILLIHLQCPNASLVCGFKKWEKEFNRHVKKNEKAIKILIPVKYNTSIDKKNSLDDSDDDILEKKKLCNKILYYKYANVFDISQTEGDELDLFKIKELEGCVRNNDNLIKTICNIASLNNTQITFETFNSSKNIKGYYSLRENKIVVSNNMSELQTIKTLIHELAHSIVHNPKLNPSVNFSDIPKLEIQAESIALIVLYFLGYDTSSYSFKYIASWAKNKTDNLLLNNLEEIKEISKFIINQLSDFNTSYLLNDYIE